MHARRLFGIAVLLTIVSLAPGATCVRAQEVASPRTNPFYGSVPKGDPSAGPVSLSIKDAISRALEHNLGLLLQEESVRSAQGARWRALEDLLPNISGNVQERRQVINLEAYGFPANPSIVGPFNVFDARIAISQPLFDLSALNDVRASAIKVHAEHLGVRSARDLVVLVSVNLYLEAVTAASRVEAAHAQQRTAEALLQQASDLKSSGLVAGIDVLRADVQVQNQRQRSIVAENDLEKAKLQLGRAIGLPPGQAITLTDTIPFAPLPPLALETALKDAFEKRPDFLAARDRLSAAEAASRAAKAELLPSLRLDADYGTIGQTASGAHPTFTVAAMVHVPVFEAGRAQARRAETEAEERRRRAEYEDFRGRVDLEVRTAFLDVNAAAQELEAADRTRTLASQTLEQARDRFAAGVAGNIEVTQAQESVAAAAETYIAALYRHNLAKATLAQAVGIAESAVMSYLGGQQ
jgi:outer membrane protein TolC